MSREFQIPMQPFVSSERDKKKKGVKSGKLVGGKGKREREGEKGRKEVFLKEEKGFRYYLFEL